MSDKHPNEMSDRELLIRVDERQGMFIEQFKEYRTHTDQRLDKVEEDKVAKSSITFVITVIGGIMGLLSVTVVLAKQAIDSGGFPLP